MSESIDNFVIIMFLLRIQTTALNFIGYCSTKNNCIGNYGTKLQIKKSLPIRDPLIYVSPCPM